ncbi:MAG TPA: late competence development ComFB family protein [Gemmatimonadales bacterium]|jgi:hypothetical protein|nr:late competence development ComFB family protein [Gemmatimonadales bacterium]
MERHVAEAFDRLKTVVKEFYDTPEHRDDVIVYALNRLPARYVVTDEGMAVTAAALGAPQHRTVIDVQVLEALHHIARSPRVTRAG